MLSELRIKNFTIIDDLSIKLHKGLNVLTGETGAGKSIIVDAIGLILGDRASMDMIKSGCKEAQIEAIFDHKHIPLLEELRIDNDDIIIRRNISLQGKGRSFINDTSVSLQTLESIGKDLVDIHGQHEHQGILKKENHLILLDSIGGLSDELGQLAVLYGKVSDLRQRFKDLKDAIHQRNQRIDFLNFQIKEIKSADLRIGEKEEIEEEIKILLNGSKLKELAERAYNILYNSEGSCIEQFGIINSIIKELTSLDSKTKEFVDYAESILSQIKDLSFQIRDLKERYEIDPKRLDILNERLDLIKNLQRKYGSSIEEIIKYKERAEEELKRLLSIEEEQETVEVKLKEKEEELILKAEEISQKRREVAKKIEVLVNEELNKLGFQKASFVISISKKDNITIDGIDDVEFLFSANVGEPPKPLSKIASGGELSRIMLAIKCIEISEDFKSSKKDSLKTLIFDEVDAGIGGITAHHVGKRLKELSNKYQVICITHLPQIAALADVHFKVEKFIIDDRTKLNVKEITGIERKEELARMLSGTVTNRSLKHAEELLNGK
jgi:DNA repair protein RecN (Recombination protein N)